MLPIAYILMYEKLFTKLSQFWAKMPTLITMGQKDEKVPKNCSSVSLVNLKLLNN
jgi:hypothetical protein